MFVKLMLNLCNYKKKMKYIYNFFPSDAHEPRRNTKKNKQKIVCRIKKLDKENK